MRNELFAKEYLLSPVNDSHLDSLVDVWREYYREVYAPPGMTVSPSIAKEAKRQLDFSLQSYSLSRQTIRSTQKIALRVRNERINRTYRIS